MRIPIPRKHPIDILVDTADLLERMAARPDCKAPHYLKSYAADVRLVLREYKTLLKLKVEPLGGGKKMASKSTRNKTVDVALDAREIAHILAGLRTLQDLGGTTRHNQEMIDTLIHDEGFEEMNADEIDLLCEQINCGGK